MNILRITLLSLSLSIWSSTYSIEQEQTTTKKVICVDWDDVLNKTFTIDLKTIIKLLPCIMQHPVAIAYVIKDFPLIMQKGEEIANRPGMTLRTAIIGVLRYLKDNNYGDFFDYQEIIMDIGINPKPINEVIEQIKELKKQGHILIGATNQNYISNCICRKKLQEQGFDPDELFSAILTTYVPAAEISENYNRKSVYMADIGIKKPNPLYFEKLKEIARTLTTSSCTFYLIDDRDENIAGANNAGFCGIHFELPRNPKTGKRFNTSQMSDAALHHAAEQLKKKLKQEGLLSST